MNAISPGACFCADMELETCPQTFQAVDVDRYVDPEAKWQTGFWLQYSTLTRRNFRRQRKRYFSKLLWGQMLFLAFATGLIWFGMPRTENTALDRLGLVITHFINLAGFISSYLLVKMLSVCVWMLTMQSGTNRNRCTHMGHSSEISKKH